MQATVPRGYVVVNAGQVRINRQLWVWHESRLATLDVSDAPGYKEMLRAIPFASGCTWSFAATPYGHQVIVYCSVLYPRDASAADIEVRTREAGRMFAAILPRLEFQLRR
jgi:hypothetical protein